MKCKKFNHLSSGSQCGRVVRGSDLKSVGRGFNLSAMLVNSQLVCLSPAVILNLVMFLN